MEKKEYRSSIRSKKLIREAFEDQVIEQMMEVLSDFKYEHFFQNPAPVLLKINRYLEEDIEFYRILITTKESDSFIEKMKKMFIEYMNTDTDIPENVRSSVGFEMRIHFFAGGIMNMYKQWFLGNLRGSLNDISMEVSQIIKESSK